MGGERARAQEGRSVKKLHFTSRGGGETSEKVTPEKEEKKPMTQNGPLERERPVRAKTARHGGRQTKRACPGAVGCRES